MPDNPWIGKLVVWKLSFRQPPQNDYGMVIDILPKANGSFNCIVVHRDGEESSIPPSELENAPQIMRGKLQWQILESLGKKLSAAQQRYDTACALMGKPA